MPRTTVSNRAPLDPARAAPSRGALAGPQREILTVEQTAAYLQIHKLTVYKYIRTGLLPAARLGKVYRLHRSDVIRFVQSRRTPAR